MRPRNLLLFLFLVFLWGSNWAVKKLGLSFVPPITFALHRCIVSSIALSPALLFLRKRIPRDRDTLGKVMLLTLVMVSSWLAEVIGLKEESSGIGAVLFFTQPLFVFCLAIPLLKEKITAIRLSGTMIGFAGVVTLFSGKISSLTLNAALIMILGAFLWAVATVYFKKYLSQVDSLVINFFQVSVGAFLLAALSLASNSFVIPKEAAYLWIILYSSVGALAIGTTIWFFLLKEEEATTVSGSTLIIPAVALLFGWQLLGESIRIESVLGSALILGGVYLVNLKSRVHVT